MINYFFIFVFIVSIIYGLASGNVEEVSDALMRLPQEGVLVFFKMAVVLVFFQGILQIALDAGIISFLARYLNKIIKPLFPMLDDKKTLDYISLNLICNFLGVGQAATGAGLKAMESLAARTKNKECSVEIITFLALNTSGFCLIPQSIISLREGYNSLNSGLVIIPSFLVSLFVFIFVIIVCRIMVRHEI